MNGLPDPRDRLKRDMVNLYSKYIMGTKPTADVSRLGATVSGQAAVNWGEPEPIDDEADEPTPAQVVSEEDESEDQVAAEAAEDDEDTLEEEGATMAGLSDVKKPEEKKKKTYDEMILEELELAKAKLLEPKKLSIADILGAGNIRKSAALIRETEKENEERQMKARELALDILGRRSTAEKEQRAAEALADYRRQMIAARQAAANKGATEADKQARSRAAALFPDLPPEQAYVEYLKKYEPPPSAASPRPEDYRIRMGRLIAQQELAKKNQGPPVTAAEAAEIEQYKRLSLLQLIASGGLE